VKGMVPLWGHRAALVAAAVAAMVATGCAAQHAGNSANSPAAHNPGSGAVAPAAPAAATAARSIPLKVPNSVSARKAVTLTGCSATGAGGLATGTVTAPAAKTATAAKAATYSITVFFTTPETTVLDYATAIVHATPGKAVPWRASGHFKAPQGMRCVLRGVSAR
jgi:hypothetical protein